VRKQKIDRRDAKHILQLLLEGRFPRVWVLNAEMRDHRQLLGHRHKLVQIRMRVKNERQHLMLNQEMQKKQKLWSAEGRAALACLPLEPCPNRRIMAEFVAVLMVGGERSTEGDSKEHPLEPWSLTLPFGRCSGSRQDVFDLDNAFRPY
jgi:hypothetical protein